MDKRISSGSPYEAELAYSRAVVRGDWCFVSGTTGFDYQTMTMPADAEAQADNAFATIADALGQAGFSMADVVRVQYTLTDPANVAAVAPALRRWLGDVRPAATMVIAELIDPRMLVEIEITALRP